jgi:hypothetical protein
VGAPVSYRYDGRNSNAPDRRSALPPRVADDGFARMKACALRDLPLSDKR